MPKKREPINPAWPYTEIVIDGTTYKMVFDYAALAQAEDYLLRQGHEVNILVPMLRRTFSSLRVLFAVSLVAYHPDLDFSETQNWVTKENILEVIQAVDAAWNEAMPKEGEGPPQPEQQPGA